MVRRTQHYTVCLRDYLIEPSNSGGGCFPVSHVLGAGNWGTGLKALKIRELKFPERKSDFPRNAITCVAARHTTRYSLVQVLCQLGMMLLNCLQRTVDCARDCLASFFCVSRER